MHLNDLNNSSANESLSFRLINSSEESEIRWANQITRKLKLPDSTFTSNHAHGDTQTHRHLTKSNSYSNWRAPTCDYVQNNTHNDNTFNEDIPISVFLLVNNKNLILSFTYIHIYTQVLVLICIRLLLFRLCFDFLFVFFSLFIQSLLPTEIGKYVLVFACGAFSVSVRF